MTLEHQILLLFKLRRISGPLSSDRMAARAENGHGLGGRSVGYGKVRMTAALATDASMPCVETPAPSS